MSRITIIPPDRFVSVDGAQHLGVDMSLAPAGVRAMHWRGTRGVIETEQGAETITALTKWLPVLAQINVVPTQPVPAPPAPPDPAQIRADRIADVDAHMNAAARALGYDNILAAVTYADEPAVPRFQLEGQAFRAWRSRVWAHCYQVLDDVTAGVRDIPTAEQLIAELPPLELPLIPAS